MKSKKEFVRVKIVFIPILILIVLGIIIFPFVNNYFSAHLERTRIEKYSMRHFMQWFDFWSEYENLVRLHTARALNPLKIKSINLVVDRLSATELLRIIKHKPQIAFDSQKRDFWINNLSNEINFDFFNVITEYGVGENIIFQVPHRIPHERSVRISPDEMVRWIIENIFAKKDTLENIPINERDTSYLLFKLDFWGDIEYTIFRMEPLKTRTG